MRSLKSTTSTSASDVVVVVVVVPPTPEPPTTSVAIGGIQRSPWHSPVPYLFGGLVAMLGLIAFALLILVCSHWNTSLISGSGQNDDSEELEMEKKKKEEEEEKSVMYEEQFVVILAGDYKPTRLATPAMTLCNTPADSYNVITDHESSSRTANKASDEKQQSRDEQEQESSNSRVEQQGSHTAPAAPKR